MHASYRLISERAHLTSSDPLLQPWTHEVRVMDDQAAGDADDTEAAPEPARADRIAGDCHRVL